MNQCLYGHLLRVVVRDQLYRRSNSIPKSRTSEGLTHFFTIGQHTQNNWIRSYKFLCINSALIAYDCNKEHIKNTPGMKASLHSHRSDMWSVSSSSKHAFWLYTLWYFKLFLSHIVENIGGRFSVCAAKYKQIREEVWYYILMISIDIESWEESTKLYKIGLSLNDSPYNSFDITVIKIKTTLWMSWYLFWICKEAKCFCSKVEKACKVNIIA